MSVQPMPETLTLEELPYARLTFVVERLKIVYSGVPKSACTSLKWLIAELAGEDLDSFQARLGPIVTGDLAIHRRDLFKLTPTLVDISPEVRRTISPDNGWFVFGAVRDPRARAFSAWQNKFLLHDPAYEEWRDADWYPQPPERADDVVRDFARFVELLRTEPDHPVARDPHFCDQLDFIRPDVIPYSRIYDVGEMPALLDDLGAHLRAQGVERELRLRRANDTVLRVNAHALPEPVRSQIEQIHAADFDSFGQLWDEAKIDRAGEWTSESLQEVRARILLHERITGLLTFARRERQRVLRLRGKLDRAEQRLDAVRRRARRGERRLEHARLSAERAGERVKALESMRSTRVGLVVRRLRRRLRDRARRG